MKGSKDNDKLIADQAKQIATLKAQLANKEAKSEANSQKQVDLASKLTSLYSDLAQIKDEELKTDDKIARLQAIMSSAQQKQNKATSDQAKKMLNVLKERKKGLQTLKEETEGYIDQGKALESHLKLLKKRQEFGEKYSETFEEGLGWMDDIDGAIKKIPIVGDFLSKAIGIDGLKEKMVEKFESGFANVEETAGGLDLSNVETELADAGSAASELTGSIGGVGDAGNIAAEGAGNIGAGMKSSVPGALSLNAAMGPILLVALAIAAAVEMIKSALEVDQEVTDMAKGLGVSKDHAHHIHKDIAAIAQDTKVVGANTKALTEAYTELTAVTGQSNVANKKMLETQVLLTKQYGLTGEEAAAFQSTSVGLGKTAEQNLATVQGMVEGYNKMTGDSMNFKDISKDIAKTSKATLASYKGDVKALTLAAVQAKKIGMSMEQTAAVANKLLDIESSIEAEMKANVLTGKHMNLTKARQLAYDGDIAGAAAEAVKQAGDYDELLKMRPTALKAVADAAGMEVDQLLKAGELEKMSQALGGEKIKDMKDLTAAQIEQLKASEAITAEKADQLLKDQQQASANEKMAAMTDKLKAVYVSMLEPIMGIIDPLMSLVDTIMPALKIATEISFYPLKMALGWVESIVKLLSGDFSGAADAFTNSFSLSFLGGDDEGAEESAEPMHDGMISGSGTVIKSPKGTYKLADEDTIIAGTELGTPGSGGEVVDSLRDMLDKVKGLDWMSLLELEIKFGMIGVAFKALPVDDIKSFGEISGTALTEAGSNLYAGLNNLTDLNGKISWWKLWELEVSFDMIEDVFDEIDMEDITAFASLANANLKDAGTNLGDGLMALIGWDENVDYSQLYNLEDSFDQIEDIFDELDIDDLVGFASLAGKDLGDIGWELQDMLDTLGKIDWDIEDMLDDMEDGFDELEDALDEMDYEMLNEFANANWSDANTAAADMASMIDQLMIPDWAAIEDVLSQMEDAMDYFEDALAELDFDLIEEFAYVDWAAADAGAAGLISMVRTLSSINWGNKEDKFEAMEDAMDYLEDALAEIDYGTLRTFANFNMGDASDNADSLINLVKQLAEIGYYRSEMADAAMALGSLDWALWEIDYDALEEFVDSIPSGLSDTSQLVIDFAANMAELAQYKDELEEAVDAADSLEDIIDELEGNDFGDFVEGFGRGLKDIATSIFGGGDDEAEAASNPAAETNKLLTTLIQKIDQPVKINISGRVIDELESQQSMRRSYNTRIDGAYGANG